MPSSRLSLTSSAIFSSRVALFTWYGSSVTMIAVRSPRTSSKATWARMRTRPRPVGVHQPDGVDRLPLAGDRLRCFSYRKIVPPVGKSGPVTNLQRSSEVSSGSSIRALARVDDLAEVVRRDVGRHADRDAGGAVDQQVRELDGRTDGCFCGAVVVVDQVDGVLVDVGQHLGGDGRQARLGVAHGGGAVAVDRAEVALAVHERVAHREVLGEADQGVVDRLVAVRVVLAHHLADDRGALAVRAGRRQAQVVHREEDRGDGPA